jgi:hypothetical protein
MSAQVTVAVISAVVAVVAALVSARTASSTAILQARLQSELEERRERADKASRLEQVMSRYRDPLLNAAFDLQSRIYNLTVGDFWVYVRSDDEEERGYAVKSTLFVIAQYLAWAEALRRGVQFLDLGELKRNQDLVGRLEAIRSTLATDSRFGPEFRIFRVHQRAIGEVMLEAVPDEDSEGGQWQCRGYASFCSKLKQDEFFGSWFDRLDRDVRELASDIGPARARLVTLQHALINLLDFLDESAVRFPQQLRSKIPDVTDLRLTMDVQPRANGAMTSSNVHTGIGHPREPWIERTLLPRSARHATGSCRRPASDEGSVLRELR